MRSGGGSALPSIRHDVTVQLLPDERPLHVASRIEYDTADPMAVRIFYADEASEVEWVFARGLLVEGRLRACGTATSGSGR